jgi:hypothetical protein
MGENANQKPWYAFVSIPPHTLTFGLGMDTKPEGERLITYIYPLLLYNTKPKTKNVSLRHIHDVTFKDLQSCIRFYIFLN